jgi:hypothetical protein
LCGDDLIRRIIRIVILGKGLDRILTTTPVFDC